MKSPAKVAFQLCLLGLVLSAVAVAASASGGSAEDTIRKGTDRWVAAHNAGDVETIVGLYAEDAVVMPPGAPRASGHGAIRAYLTQAVADSKEVTLAAGTVNEVGVSGDVAWHSGNYTVTDRKSGAVVDGGSYMEIWRRAGGAWRIVRDIWNSDGATAAK